MWHSFELQTHSSPMGLSSALRMSTSFTPTDTPPSSYATQLSAVQFAARCGAVGFLTSRPYLVGFSPRALARNMAVAFFFPRSATSRKS